MENEEIVNISQKNRFARFNRFIRLNRENRFNRQNRPNREHRICRFSLRNLLGLRRGESLLLLLSMLMAVALNALLLWKYHHRFFICGKVGFYSLFTRTFQVSGFDPYTLIAMSNEQVCFDLSRHPLLLSLLYPFYWLNSWLMDVMGWNCAAILMAAINVAAFVGASLSLFRLLRYILRLKLVDCYALWAAMLGVAYVMLAVMVPDHFCLSLFLLTYTLYRAALLMRFKKPMSAIEAGLLFFLTAGVTLTNGLKTCLAVWFTAGRRAFSVSRICALLLSTATLFALWYWQNEEIVLPQQHRGHQIERKLAEKFPEKMRRVRQHEMERKQKNGEALTHDESFLRYSDISTPRLRSLSDNLFGETFLLHRDYLLQDVQRNRPVFVAYKGWLCPAIELCLVAIMALGFWYGRRERLCLLLASWLLFDALMHVGFGFALNEVYIMAAHWAFALPILAAYCIRRHSLFRLAYIPFGIMLIHNLWLVCEYCS